MHIIITSATEMEARLLKEKINAVFHPKHRIDFHVSGVGIMLSTFSLSQLFGKIKPDLIIQCGIAGTYQNQFSLGEIVVVKSETLGNIGVMENGEWKDVFDNQFIDKNNFPFQDKKLVNPWLENFQLNLPLANGVTIEEITTQFERIKIIQEKYAADVESMEGAPFHYVCLQNKIPFIQFRGISNLVGERNKKNWKITQTIEKLSAEIFNFIQNL